ncbi:hypothetical protein K7X08_025316 [Anisodus acutangulus]|uniref:Uncharacterized protein n=1 Tax=Anisodus acutangulus TaxID=402998 RepID=A0A9Q1LW02_9SOLA|nr:hypothetical protein K7X08_025316 [Anisodus acutangulus]
MVRSEMKIRLLMQTLSLLSVNPNPNRQNTYATFSNDGDGQENGSAEVAIVVHEEHERNNDDGKTQTVVEKVHGNVQKPTLYGTVGDKDGKLDAVAVDGNEKTVMEKAQDVHVHGTDTVHVLMPTKNSEDPSKSPERFGTQSPEGVGSQTTEGVERVLWSDQMEEEVQDGEISYDKSYYDCMTSSHQLENVENNEEEVNKSDESLKDINPATVNIAIVFADPNAHVRDQIVNLVQCGAHGITTGDKTPKHVTPSSVHMQAKPHDVSIPSAENRTKTKGNVSANTQAQ